MNPDTNHSEIKLPSGRSIIVDSLLEQGSRRIGDDQLSIGEDTFVVFDGSNSLIPYKNPDGHTGGFLAAHIAKKVFMSESGSLRELVIKANHAINWGMLDAGVKPSSKSERWSTKLAAIRVNNDNLEWSYLGDCAILIIKDDGSSEVLTEEDHDRDTMIQWRKLADAGVNDIRTKLDNVIIANREQANIDYGDLNGEEEVVKFIQTGEISLTGIKHVLLFTDGLFLPKEDPKQEVDFQEMARLFREGGLRGLRDKVRSMEEGDPKCHKYPRFKQYDDIAAIAVTLLNK